MLIKMRTFTGTRAWWHKIRNEWHSVGYPAQENWALWNNKFTSSPQGRSEAYTQGGQWHTPDQISIYMLHKKDPFLPFLPFLPLFQAMLTAPCLTNISTGDLYGSYRHWSRYLLTDNNSHLSFRLWLYKALPSNHMQSPDTSIKIFWILLVTNITV